MIKWDDFRFMLAVHKSGTMTGAARLLNSNVATVSRRIDRLSESLGMPAFVKYAEGWRANARLSGLMEAAEEFDFALTREMNGLADNGRGRPVPIRIGAPPVVCANVLFPSLDHSLTALEGVRLEFFDRVTGEGLGDYDIVLQSTRPETGRVVTRRVGELWFRIYGQRDRDISTRWIGLSRVFDPYPVIQMARTHFGGDPFVRANDFSQVFEVMRSSGLPGPLPDVLARRAPELVPLSDPQADQRVEFWIMYHASRRDDPAIQTVVDWITGCFRSIRQPAEGRSPIAPPAGPCPPA